MQPKLYFTLVSSKPPMTLITTNDPITIIYHWRAETYEEINDFTEYEYILVQVSMFIHYGENKTFFPLFSLSSEYHLSRYSYINFLF